MTENMIGNKYGKLVVIKEVESGKRGRMYECLCECGNSKAFAGKDLRSINHKSCGCLNHGMSFTPIHQAWGNMKRRCNKPKNKSYARYGGRGITYDPKWETFENFYADMKDGYKEGLTLDRIDVDGNYNKDNCRWTDKETQANNTSTNRFITYKGKRLTIAQLCRKYNVPKELFSNRFYALGWSVEDSLEKPVEREKITYNGVEKTVSQFADEYGLKYHQLKKRLMRGWDIERALTEPIRKK